MKKDAIDTYISALLSFGARRRVVTTADARARREACSCGGLRPWRRARRMEFEPRDLSATARMRRARTVLDSVREVAVSVVHVVREHPELLGRKGAGL